MSSNAFPFITDGIVKDTNDPLQMGRVRIWCPTLDGENFDVEILPWAEYATPFGGVTNNFKAGRNKAETGGPVSYGFWALPKIGSQVLVFLLNGDNNRRFYFAGYFGLCRNRSIPAGRNVNNSGATGPWSDSYDKLQPAYDNLRTAFQGNVESSQAKTRGAFDRQVAQARTEKDGTDGYATSAVDSSYLDSQTYCFVTPGHHVFLMDDSPDNCRIRLKTCEGNQVIIDDTNERIYISTSKGKTWVELDEDGHVHVFGSESISMRAGKDVNIYADRNVNIEAGNNINLKAVDGTLKAAAKKRIDLRSETDSIYQTACKDFHVMSEKGLYMTALDIHINAEKSFNSSGGSINSTCDDIKIRGTSIELDGGNSLMLGARNIKTFSSSGSHSRYSSFGKASPSDTGEPAQSSDSPPVVPNQEPWKRPPSAKPRNKNWKE